MRDGASQLCAHRVLAGQERTDTRAPTLREPSLQALRSVFLCSAARTGSIRACWELGRGVGTHWETGRLEGKAGKGRVVEMPRRRGSRLLRLRTLGAALVREVDATQVEQLNRGRRVTYT